MRTKFQNKIIKSVAILLLILATASSVKVFVSAKPDYSRDFNVDLAKSSIISQLAMQEDGVTGAVSLVFGKSCIVALKTNRVTIQDNKIICNKVEEIIEERHHEIRRIKVVNNLDVFAKIQVIIKKTEGGATPESLTKDFKELYKAILKG